MLGFKEIYKKEIVPEFIKKMDYKSAIQVPKILKVTLNMGVKDAVLDKKHIQAAQEELTLIAGQKAVVTSAKKSIAGFKLREGMPVGCVVTLRASNMYHFLERLVYVALPRSREFRGFNKKNFDGQGNLNLGIKEHIVFPEINYDKIAKIRGLNISIVTSAKTDQEAKDLLGKFNFPFKD